MTDQSARATRGMQITWSRDRLWDRIWNLRVLESEPQESCDHLQLLGSKQVTTIDMGSHVGDPRRCALHGKLIVEWASGECSRVQRAMFGHLSSCRLKR